MLKYLNLNHNLLYFFLIIVGIFTIFYQINFEDFWLDEMQSFWIADPELSWNETFERHKNSDYHNPVFFNLVLKYFLDIAGYNPDRTIPTFNIWFYIFNNNRTHHYPS